MYRSRVLQAVDSAVQAGRVATAAQQASYRKRVAQGRGQLLPVSSIPPPAPQAARQRVQLRGGILPPAWVGNNDHRRGRFQRNRARARNTPPRLEREDTMAIEQTPPAQPAQPDPAVDKDAIKAHQQQKRLEARQRNAYNRRLAQIKRVRETDVYVETDLATYTRGLFPRHDGPLHRHGGIQMNVPTHLLAIELVPAQDTGMDQPPLPGMPSPLHRLRVHQFHVTVDMEYSTSSGPWVESVEDMDYLHPTWLTLTPRSKDLDTVCSQVHAEVARAYDYLNSAKGYSLAWFTQAHLQSQDTTLEGQTWERALGWAWAIIGSSLSSEDPRLEAAKRFLQVYNLPHTHGQTRSQLYVALGTSTGKRSTPGTLAMARSDSALKAVRTPYV